MIWPFSLMTQNGRTPAKKEEDRPGARIREETRKRRKEQETEEDPCKTACEGLRKAVEDRDEASKTLVGALNARSKKATPKPAAEPG